MTTFVASSAADGPVRLSGTICNYRAARGNASFVFTPTDRTAFGLVAIAAAVADLGGQATSLASNASALEEAADFVEFDIDGKPVSGWVWHSPFKEGDTVDVAAQWHGNHYALLGAARPADRTIALYPHCTRSTRSHIRNAIKWWLYVSLLFDVGMIAMTSSFDGITFSEVWDGALTNGVAAIIAGMHAAIGVAVFSMARKWMPFTQVAESVFKTLGLPGAENIDLVKSSKGQRQDSDSFEFGAMYFRY